MELNEYITQFPCYPHEELQNQQLHGVVPCSTTYPYDKVYATHKLIKKKVLKDGADLLAISFLKGSEPRLEVGEKTQWEISGIVHDVQVLMSFPLQHKGYRAWCYIVQQERKKEAVNVMDNDDH
ncbi:hypothetical protein [Pectobacterium brasiliense]|uniref:hypothetical protein n=1 Tax=Pectobacterium brasiliense TaxID=180957 RepID=UPI0005807976|nr:hypothetical protein [Pectobacterium brasiliense]KHT18306.1 hypothetical protein RC97_11895 [Pectobacterium brasiliense]MCG5047675.1 hypothetical protein [Pectobacterium brasiliense]